VKMKKRIPESPKGREKLFKEVLSLSQKGETDIFFELGRRLMDEYAPRMYEYAPRDFHLAYAKMPFNYVEMGEKFWATTRKKLYKLFCDRASKAPKTWVKELMGSDLRNVWIALLGEVTGTCDVTLAIAIPIGALLLKKGILAFCSRPPRTET